MSGQQYNTNNPTLLSSSNTTSYSDNSSSLQQQKSALQTQPAPLPTQATLPEDTKQTKHGMGAKLSDTLHKITGVLHHEKAAHTNPSGTAATTAPTGGLSSGATTLDNSPLYTTSLLSSTLPSALPDSRTSVSAGPTIVQAVVPPPVMVEPLNSTRTPTNSSSSFNSSTLPTSSSSFNSSTLPSSSLSFNSSTLPAAPASYIEQSTYVGPTEVRIENDADRRNNLESSRNVRGTVLSSTTSSVTQVKDTPIITTETRVLPQHQIPVQTEKIIPAQQIQVQSERVIPEKHIPVTETKVIPEQRIPITETRIIPEKHIPVTEMKTVPEQRIPLGSKREIQETSTTTTTQKKLLETEPRIVGASVGTTQQQSSSTFQSSSLNTTVQPRIEQSTFVGPTKVSVSSSSSAATPGLSNTDQSFNKSLRQ